MTLLHALLVLAACGGDASDALPEPAARPAPSANAVSRVPVVRTTQSGRYEVEVTFEPERPAMGELFAVVATVRDQAGEPVEDAKVALDARMPQHNHGMMTDPEDLPGACDDDGACTHPGGVYRTEGFKFHMGGDWTVTVDVKALRGSDSTSFVYTQE